MVVNLTTVSAELVCFVAKGLGNTLYIGYDVLCLGEYIAVGKHTEQFAIDVLCCYGDYLGLEST